MNTVKYGFEPIFKIEHKGEVCSALIGYCPADSEEWGVTRAVVFFETGDVYPEDRSFEFTAEEKAAALLVAVDGPIASSENEMQEFIAVLLTACDIPAALKH